MIKIFLKTKQTLFILFVLLGFNAGNAQILPSNAAPFNSAAYLINNILLGNGVTATNITYNGNAMSLGYFGLGNSGVDSLGIDSGIVLSTGDIMDLSGSGFATTSTQVGNNLPNDLDIQDIIHANSPGTAANDVAILEFDFIPLGDTIKFDYMFASEEYPEFVCSFNDGFGMFLSGPGITGPFTNNAANIAIVPYTNPPLPVSIYNVNATTNSCSWANNNDSLYTDNPTPTDFCMDGFTHVFTASSPVLCGSQYHLKFAIADAGDHSYDSGVFLKARSLVSNQVSFIPTSSSGIIGDSSLVEGCLPGALTFNRPGNLDSILVVHIVYGGSAIMGSDYNVLPDSVVFTSGVSQIVIPVTAFQDNIAEPFADTITISLQFIGGCGGLTQFTRYMYIINPLPVTAVLTDLAICPGDSAIVTAGTINGYPPFTYLWSTGDTTSSISFLPTQDTTQVWVSILSQCVSNIPDIDSSLVSIIPFNPISINYNYPTFDLVENCGDTVYVSFDLDHPSTVPFGISLSLTSPFNPATNGVDYHTLNNALFPDSLNYAIGDSAITIALIITPDNIADNFENIDISLNQISQCTGSNPFLSLNIIQFNTASVFVQNPSPVCPGVPTDIFANVSGTSANTVGYAYSWSGGNTSTSDVATYTLTASQSITVTVYDTVCGLPYDTTKTILVNVSPPLVVGQITANTDTVVCSGDAVNLQVLAAGLAPIQYTWTNGSTTTNANVNPISTQSYGVLVTDQCNSTGITQNITIEVPVYNTLIATTSADTTFNCPGTNILVFADVSGGAPGKQTYWNGILSNILNADTLTFDTNGVYVKFKVTDVCGNSAKDSTLVRLRSYHSIGLTLSADTTGCPNAKLRLNGTVTRQNYDEGFDYSWTMLNNSNNSITGSDSINTFTVLTDTTTNNMYLLTVTDICGVEFSDTTIIKRKSSCDAKTYNVFTPGDGNDVNARFRIDAVDEYPNTGVVIFNRWGKKVFETASYKNNDATNSWGAEDNDAGTYYYIVTFTDPPGRKAPEPVTGFVDVIK